VQRPLAELVHVLTSELERALGGSTDECRREVQILLAHVCGLPDRARLYTTDVEVGPTQERRLRELVARRGGGEPVAYLTGTCEFYGLTFRVGSDVLIPRPETELLVEVCLAAISAIDQPRILEIGVGSGAVSIALLREHPGARITASDVSRGALRVAGANAERLGVADRLALVEADLAPPELSRGRPHVDLVVSNPPYVAETDVLSPGVREFEPAVALFASGGGLSVIERIASAASGWLKPQGTMALGGGSGQAETVRSLMTSAGFAFARVHDDLAGIGRVVSGVRAP
jgi:release factor glutamine methyltransferase